MPTLAERAVELGFTATNWFDTSQGHPGVEHTATLNPAAADWLSRYGTNGQMIEYNPRNWAGAHAPAGNIDAPIVYLEVFKQLGKPIEKSPNDLSDLDMVDGLTRFVMDQAARLRITADGVLGQGGGQGGGDGHGGGGTVDPCASVKAELAIAKADLAKANEQIALMQYASETLKAISKTLRGVPIPVRGGGQAWNVVRQIDKLVNG